MPVKALGEIEALQEKVRAVLYCVICILNTGEWRTEWYWWYKEGYCYCLP